MNIPRIRIAAPTDHGSEIALLLFIAVGVMILCGVGIAHATAEKPFDPSAYLVVLTLIVGAIKERWTQRSVDRMGDSLATSQPRGDAQTGPSGEPDDPVSVKPV